MVDPLVDAWRRNPASVSLFGLVLAGAVAFLWTSWRRPRPGRSAAHVDGERLALALDGSELGLWDLDLKAASMVVDARANMLLGHPGAETTISWDAWRMQIHPQDWDEVLLQHEACLRDERPQRVLRCRMQHADGRWVWVVDRGKVLARDAHGQPSRMVGTRIDISAAVLTQEALKRSDERLRQVVRSAGIGVFEHHHATGIIDSTAEHHAIWGFQPNEVVALDRYLAQIHPDDAERVVSLIRECHDPDGNGVFDSEHRIVRPDGQVRWILTRSQTVFEGVGASRRPLRTVGGITDITEAKAAQERIARQASLLDEAQDAIVVRELDGRIAYWNGGAERIYGWTAAEAVGRDIGELLQQEPVLAAKIRAQLLAAGQHTHVVPERCKDGRNVQMEGHFTLLRDDHGRPQAYLAIKTDITRRLELEAQLRQAQRLESIGQLTGGVAHDFNNLLTVILGNADLLVEQLADRPPLLRLAEMTRDAALSGAELTHRLLAFARRQPLQPQTININEKLAGMQALLRRTLREDIELELVQAAGLWRALVDPAQLESAVLNLVLNARDAMPEAGRITLETGNAHIDDDYAQRHDAVKPGQYVVVSVSDSGQGMLDEQLARAFEPFYTTKGAGKGTGLGLSMVYGFVKQSDGHVKLYSEPGHGTTARIYLPRSLELHPMHRPLQPTEAQDYLGNAKILVVEDDALVRSFAQTVLQRLGHTVVLAEHGPAALAALRDHPDIDLLFSDVVMPGGMNGRELAQAAWLLRPTLKVLFTSGYTENAIVHHGRLDGGVNLLQKPYRGVDLARRVWTVLKDG